jgi:hypothetical protein
MSTTFFGRERELARLQTLFSEVAQRDSKGKSTSGPRMAVILAHTGVGKTRLAQELYRWLASHPQWDQGDFWPDDLGEDGDSLRVNPKLPPQQVQPLVAWWGMRARCPERNQEPTAGIVDHGNALRELAVLRREVRVREPNRTLRLANDLLLGSAHRPLKRGSRFSVQARKNSR